MEAEIRKEPISRVLIHSYDPCEDIPIEISGPFEDSLGGNQYAAHFMEPRTDKSDVLFLKIKREIPDISRNYIAMVESHFYKKYIQVRNISAEKAGENMGAKLLEWCHQNGIEFKPSPARTPESNGMDCEGALDQIPCLLVCHRSCDSVLRLSIEPRQMAPEPSSVELNPRRDGHEAVGPQFSHGILVSVGVRSARLRLHLLLQHSS